MLTRNYAGIIFDLDGTLYNLKWLGFNFMASHLTTLKYLKASRKNLRKLSGIHTGSKESFFELYYRTLSEFAGTSPEKAEKWETEVFYKNFISILKRYSARPGVGELLARLNIPTAVVSDYGMIDDRLKSIKIDPEIFTVRFYSGNFGGLKPNPEILLKAAEAINIAPAEILVVGDMQGKDGKAAERAGMDYFHVDDESWPLLMKNLNNIE
ncbi:MAG TPA: hypothetical protein DCO79_09545 [Spirochaeta sp.]|nr:hypothetical protein [Spirochaeta sp.]